VLREERAVSTKRQFSQSHVDPTSDQEKLLHWKRAHLEDAQTQSRPTGVPVNPIALARLNAALSECGLPAVECADLQAIAKRVEWAITRFRVFSDLTSVTRARDENDRAGEIRLHAIKLARLLSTPSGVLAASLEGDFEQAKFSDGGLMSPFELPPMLRELGCAARRFMRRPRAGSPAVPKRNGRSPMQRLVQELAQPFETLSGSPANVARINSEGKKGGAFFDFVCAVAAQWKFRPPSVEAVAQALRSA
jgi:hypothetical protein